MLIDEPTFTTVLGIASSIVGGMFFTLRVFAKDIPGLLFWAVGCLAIGSALLIDGPRYIDDWQVASMLFNILFGSGQALILAGIMQFCGLRHVTRTLVSLILLRIVLTIVFTYILPISSIRIATLSSYQALVSVWSAWILWRYADPFARTVFRFASGFKLIQALAALSQGVIVATSGLSVSYAAPELPIANIISWFGTLISILVANWMLFLLVMLRLVGDLKRAADIDLLTGLSNRRGLRRHLDVVLERVGRGACGIGVLLLDIDHFKLVNDTLGHQVGDKVLVAMGEVLRNCAAPDVLSSRWGGEEFCVIVENPTSPGLSMLAESIRADFFAKSGVAIGDNVGRTVSVGVAYSAPGHMPEIARLIAEADAQLYCAKKNGRDQTRTIEVADASTAPIK